MPELFGRYELLRRIGAGGMAEAFVAKTFGAEGFVKEVVIKRILPAFSEDPDFVRMFINEARLAARLQHTNIVQIFDFNHVYGTYYIAMEWVDGVDLRRVMNVARSRALPVPARAAIHVGVETLKGLHYAHSKAEAGTPLQLVHRDISPHNLLLSFAGEVKITDFGIAKAAAQASATRSGAVKGKLAYMSPEQVAGCPLDGRSDLFSLGIILWELLAGRRLYQADSEMELFAKVRKGEIPLLRQVAPEVPEALEAFCMRLLAVELGQRYRTAAEALADLGHFAEVGDSFAMSEYLRCLLPAEAERDKRGSTAIYGQAVGSAPVLTADPDAPTHTRFTKQAQGGVEAASWLDRGSPASRLDEGVLGGDVFGGSIRWRRTAAFSALAALGVVFFAGMGWWISEPPSTPTAPATLTGSDLAQLLVESRPPAAAVTVDGVPVGRTPLALQGRAGVELLLTAELEDQAVSRRTRLVPGHQRVMLHIAAEQGSGKAAGTTEGEVAKNEGGLESLQSGPVPPVLASARSAPPGQQPQEGMTGRSAVKQAQPSATAKQAAKRDLMTKRGRKSDPPKAFGRTSQAAKANWGTLDVVVSPWARVKVNGKEIGQTPIKGHRLRPGLYVIEISNSEINKNERIRVSVGAKRLAEIRREWGY